MGGLSACAGGCSTDLPQAGPLHGETQELTSLLQEAEQVMLALQQMPTIGSSHSVGLPGPPMRAILQKVQSWVEYSQLSSVDTCSTYQPPYSPLSRPSLTASAGHTLGNSDSDMMDFIPALSLPMQLHTAQYGTHGAQAVSVNGQKQQAGVHAIPVVPTIEPSAPATQMPLSSHRSVAETTMAAPTGRPGYAAKPGSSTDTLPGPPATSFSAASDSDAVGPSTPSNSFAQGSASVRPASLPVTVRLYPHRNARLHNSTHATVCLVVGEKCGTSGEGCNRVTFAPRPIAHHGRPLSSTCYHQRAITMLCVSGAAEPRNSSSGGRRCQ